MEVFVRGSLTYLGLLVLLHVGLKREAGSLGVADMLLVTLISDASQNAMSAEYRSVTDGFVLVATLLFWNYAVDRLAYHFPAFGRLLEPPPVLLVKDGRYLRRNMRREYLTEEDLAAELRKKGVEDVAEVKEARMESDGEISVSGASRRGRAGVCRCEVSARPGFAYRWGPVGLSNPS